MEVRVLPESRIKLWIVWQIYQIQSIDSEKYIGHQTVDSQKTRIQEAFLINFSIGMDKIRFSVIFGVK
jgi:hypothetical protein